MNILIIMADQHNARYLGCADHPVIRTPNLDRLAAAGARFPAAYCSSPLCGPSRMSFLSGLYPCHSGVYANGQPLPSDIPTYAHALGAAGYATALAGRMHIVGDDQRHGFEEKIGPDVTASTLGGGMMPLLEGLHAGSGPAGLTLSGPGDSSYQHYDDDVVAQSCAWLRRRDAARPFCLTVGLALPHNPFVCAPDDYAMYAGRISLREDPENLHPAWHPAIDAFKRAGVTREDQLRALAAYAGSVTATDRRVGRLLDTLDQLDLAGDTLVVYTSDHGETAGAHGLWYKCSAYEGSAAVPLILRLPGRIPPGRLQPECVNLVDLTATVLDLAGAPALPDSDGRSFRGLWADPSAPWDNTTFCEYGTRWGRSLLLRMVRHDAMKYVYYHGQPDELFDLAADPEERANRAEHPDYQTTRQELRQLVMRGWNPEQVNAWLDLWGRRESILYQWYASRPRNDPELYQPPPGCNRLDLAPGFKPKPTIIRGSY